MRIQWDAVLVAATARALDRRVRGHRIRSYHLDPDRRRLAVFLREETLVWELHPERLGFRVLPAMDPPPEATSLPARVETVRAPADDRVMVLEWKRVRGRPPVGRLVLELLPNQENIVSVEGPDHTVRALLRTRDGPRGIRRGHPYVPPPPSEREGIDRDPGSDWWTEVLAGVEPGQEKRVLLRRVAWTSPLVIPSLLDADGYHLWRRLRAAALGEGPRDAAVVAGRHGPQAYPVPLPERTLSRTDGLLDAFHAVTESEGSGEPTATLIPGFLVEALEAEVERARSRSARLEEELADLQDPEELRRWGDLILARFHQVPEGRDAVQLEGFEGGTVTIPLDPALSPDANARRHYDRAAKLRRAQDDLPVRIRAARQRWKELEVLRERMARGEASREEVEDAVPDRDTGSGAGDPAAALPYRRFRSSGGLEIRVGRGAAKNDDLTFHHARPDEIWLHARHAAGAHVILRWSGEGSPPPRDLHEAAVLAAVHSKARTSGTVPVDWTRRKYVRKPRKAPPGAVTPERVQTLFVKPTEALVDRLGEE